MWREETAAGLSKETKLRDLYIPGTHDACTFIGGGDLILCLNGTDQALPAIYFLDFVNRKEGVELVNILLKKNLK